MKDFIKNNKLVIFLCIVLCIVLYLTQSYHKKSEQEIVKYENHIKILKEEQLKIIKEKEQLKIELSKQLEILKKKNKKTNIKIIENKDGSKTKEISIDESNEDSLKQKEDNKLEQNKDKENIEQNKKEDIKEDTKLDKEIKKVELEKSNSTSVLLMIGGLVVCFATGICAF